MEEREEMRLGNTFPLIDLFLTTFISKTSFSSIIDTEYILFLSLSAYTVWLATGNLDMIVLLYWESLSVLSALSNPWIKAMTDFRQLSTLKLNNEIDG